MERKLNNVNEEIQLASKIRKRVNGKTGFSLEDPPDGIIKALNFDDTDFFPNIRKLLILGAASPIGSTKAGKVASGIRRLKTPYRSKMGDKTEWSEFSAPTTNIKQSSIAQMFIRTYPRKMFKKSVLFEY